MLKKTGCSLFCLMLCAILLALWPAAAGASNPSYAVSPENGPLFRSLLNDLLAVSETPSDSVMEEITSLLDQIGENSDEDAFLARAIAEHWYSVFLNTDGTYSEHVFQWDRSVPRPVASELADTPLRDCPSHAFIVLGYQLEDGEMTEELKGRCEAAAAAARAFPDSLLVCTGGATGGNNPEHHTEAGRMKEYLVTVCGLDADRILTDDLAMTTIDNAVNAISMLRERGIHAMTVVTSDYHEKWGQVLCNAEAALNHLRYGYDIRLVSNYCYQTGPQLRSGSARSAISQLTSLLHLSSYAPLPTELP